jgi:hypothetical protein
MKALWAMPLLAVLTVGCLENTNRVVVRNLSIANVKLHFRGEAIDIDAGGGSATITGIEDGTYDYSTIVQIPLGVSSENISAGEGLSGSLHFDRRDTKISIVYTSKAEPVEGSTEEQGQSAAYVIEASVSSSRSNANPVSEG